VVKDKPVKLTLDFLRSELKKPWKDRISIYKNNPNLDYNMELKVPKKWSHLDYSKLGNPPEVEYSKEELRKIIGDPRDELGSRPHIPKSFLTIGKEDAVLNFFVEGRDRIKDFLVPERYNEYKWFFSRKGPMGDINNFIRVDEKTGRKIFVRLKDDESVEDKISGTDTSKLPAFERTKWLFLEMPGISKYIKDGPNLFAVTLNWADTI